MKSFYFDGSYSQKQSLLTKLSWQKGEHDFLRKSVIRTCAKSGCKNIFKSIPSDPKIYCSQRCSAIINNKKRIRKIIENRFCSGCGVILNSRYKIQYCSNKCQMDYRYNNWIDSWKKGLEDGNVGITAKTISGHLRRYLTEKSMGKCSICGWSEVNTITSSVPLEIDHIDGNSENNTEQNLRVICPNCHALSPNYKNLNRGKGRKWRMDKYIRN